jgi:hypothetical protein
MSPAARRCGFLILLALVFGVAYATGAHLGPVQARPSYWRATVPGLESPGFSSVTTAPGRRLGPASAVLQYLHNAPFDVKEVLRTRMERQQRVFDREDPPTAVFIMDEQVLRREVGGPEAMSRQLLHLIELAEQPNVIMQLVPAGTGYYPGLVGAFMIAKFDGIEIAFQDGTITGHVLEDRDQVSALTRVWENIHAVALPQAASIELIAKVVEEWKS